MGRFRFWGSRSASDEYWREVLHKRTVWDDYAQAAEAIVEGNRLISEEIARSAVNLGRRSIAWFGVIVRQADRRRHLPPW